MRSEQTCMRDRAVTDSVTKFEKYSTALQTVDNEMEEV